MLKKLIDIEFLALFLITLGFGLLFTYNFFLPFGEQQFVYLSYAFLHGQLSFLLLPPHASDQTLFQGHYFWPAGPLPAVLLMPFVAIFGFNFHQGFILFFLHLLNFYLLYKIAFNITSSSKIAFWASAAFIFSTTYLYVAIYPWSWFLSQILTVTMLLLAINESLYKQRFLLVGIFLGGAILSRTNVILSLPFFLMLLNYSRTSLTDKRMGLIQLLTPLVVGLLLLGAYNFARFGNIIERGDSFTRLVNDITTNNRSVGLWSLIHYPANLYYLFLKGPEPIFLPGTQILNPPYMKASPWGMSIFLTSPILLWIFKASWQEPLVRFATAASIFILVFNLGWFSIGYQQYGYRYALDFQPFLFVLLCFGVKNGISKLFQTITIASFFLNFIFIPTIFLS